MFTTPLEVLEWLNRHNIKQAVIGSNLVVDTQASISLTNFKGSELPIRFATVNGYFDASCTPIASIQGFPHTINGSFTCNNTKIVSLSGIDKVIKRIDGRIICSHPTHMLGLLLIEGVKEITISSNGMTHGKEWTNLSKIMNKHLMTRDILAAQDELIDVGYIEQARL